MVDFDIILGMDWLASNNAIVDCKWKRVKLRTPNQAEIVYHGKSKKQKSLLSASQAWKAMKSGEDTYLEMINEVQGEVEMRIEDIPIVCEFPDVFPEELPGTVPDREVEFEINLVSGAAPISKAPYRMAPAELKELKEQLQELLDKKQIRPRHVISEAGVLVDPKKVEAITEWPKPKNATDIRSFLGLAGYYRKFIEGFSSIAITLTKLTQKNSKFIWDEGCEKSFQTLKEKLASTPVLILPTEDKEFTIYSKANKVADALSRKNGGKITLASLSAQPCLQETVKLNQDRDPELKKLKEQVESGKSHDLQIDDKGVLCMNGRLCVPDSDNLRQEILSEAHKSKFSVHPGSKKCTGTLRVKAEHQRPGGLLQPLEIPEWKWEHISMDFVVGLPKSRQGQDGIWITVDKVTVVREKLKAAQDRQKSWADLKRRPVEFNVGDKAYVKVSLMKGVVRFSKAGKLNPRYVGPFEILEKVGTPAYRLALPPNMSRIHNVFHVSQLRKYISDPSHVLEVEPLIIESNLGEELKYEEVPIRVVDTKDQVLRRRIIPYVKVQWSNHTEREATWELEERMRNQPGVGQETAAGD
ncbi:uncharacterized protein LOC142504875 [Primulina tabacum]|uniref:uncharacterized protein LOC142504875 n=1 Tax=Primulina tabacum TaxID=48773 RepID=UPI003F5A18C5